MEICSPMSVCYTSAPASEGTSLENTFVDNFKGIRHWLNVTKLHNPMFAVMNDGFMAVRTESPSGDRSPPRRTHGYSG